MVASPAAATLLRQRRRHLGENPGPVAARFLAEEPHGRVPGRIGAARASSASRDRRGAPPRPARPSAPARCAIAVSDDDHQVERRPSPPRSRDTPSGLAVIFSPSVSTVIPSGRLSSWSSPCTACRLISRTPGSAASGAKMLERHRAAAVGAVARIALPDDADAEALAADPLPPFGDLLRLRREIGHRRRDAVDVGAEARAAG